MCFVELKVSTLDCRHRYYLLTQPCVEGRDLDTCPSKPKIRGWEERVATCPYCDGSASDEDIVPTTPPPISLTAPGSMRLIGSDRNPSVGGLSQYTQRARATSSLSRRSTGRGSSSASSLYSAHSRRSSEASLKVYAAASRAQHARIENYLANHLDRTSSDTEVRRSGGGGGGGGTSPDSLGPAFSRSETVASESSDIVSPVSAGAGGGGVFRKVKRMSTPWFR